MKIIVFFCLLTMNLFAADENTFSEVVEEFQGGTKKAVTQKKTEKRTMSDQVQAIIYLKVLNAGLHQAPDQFSTTLTTLSCAHPLKVLQTEKQGWIKVEASGRTGYVLALHTAAQKNLDCFQDRYPHFFNQLNLDLVEVYYWGRLYDQWEVGHVKAK